MNKNKFYTCRNDRAMKYILLKKDNWDILEAILEEVLGEKIIVTGIRNSELIEKNIFERGKIVDALIESTGKIIEIELNAEKKKYTRKRNTLYLFNIYQSESLSGESLIDNSNKLMFYQINLTYGLDTNINIINTYMINNCTTKEELWISDLAFYEINMSKIDKMCYDNIEKDNYKYLRMLNINKDKLNEYCRGDKLMEKYERELLEVNKNPKFQELMTYEQEQKMIENTIKDESLQKGLSQGLSRGLKKGVTKNKIDTAKKMLRDNLDINTISKYTGLSTKEIEKLK